MIKNHNTQIWEDVHQNGWETNRPCLYYNILGEGIVKEESEITQVSTHTGHMSTDTQ